MHASNTEVLGYHIFKGDLNRISLFKKLIINTINAHSYNVAKQDHLFYKALQASDILLPDGASVVIGAKLLQGSTIKKIAGYDVYIHLLGKLNETGGSCFFLGAQPQTLQLIEKRLNMEYPNIKVGSYSPPFVPEFSEDDTRQMCDVINSFHPQVLFVGMTAPKQEKWVYINKNRIHANVICSIGAVFDFYARTKKRPAQWMITYNLEWFGRFLCEPYRLFHRYFVSTPIIFVDVFLQKMHVSNRTKLLVTKEPETTKLSELEKTENLDYNYQDKELEKGLSRRIQRKKKEKQKIEESWFTD